MIVQQTSIIKNKTPKIEKNVLRTKFPSQDIHRVITMAPEYRDALSLTERYVFSCLLWGFKKQPIGITKLSKYCHVGRQRTLPRILKKLESLGLAERVGSEWKGRLLTTHQLFAKFTAPNGESKRCYNLAVANPNILEGLIMAADAIKPLKPSLLAARFGVHRMTITAARKRLKGIPQVKPVKKPKPEAVPKIEMEKMIDFLPTNKTEIEQLCEVLKIDDPEVIALLEELVLTKLKNIPSGERNMAISIYARRFSNLADQLAYCMSTWRRPNVPPSSILHQMKFM